MLFDKLCKIAERDHGERHKYLLPALRRAALIAYEPEAGVIATDAAKASPERTVENFFMPFSVCAVERVLSADETRSAMPHVAVMESGCLGGNLPDGVQMAGEPVFTSMLLDMRDSRNADGISYALLLGAASFCYGEGSVVMVGSWLTEIHFYSRELRYINGQVGDLGPDRTDSATRTAGDVARHAAGISMQYLSYFNDPDNIVVSAQPTGRPLWNPNTKVKRSDARPRYMAVPRKKVLRVMGVSEQEESELRKLMHGHPRRAHWRELRADRFVNKQGQRIKVRECWIGPEETEYRGVRYKVHLGTPEELAHA